MYMPVIEIPDFIIIVIVMQASHPRISNELLSRLPTPPDSNSDADVDVTFGSEDWHATVPSVCYFMISKLRNVICTSLNIFP